MSFAPVTDRELYWNFACAEANSPRYGQFYAQLPPILLERLKKGERDALTDQDWRLVKAAASALRAPIIGQLVELGTDWYHGNLSVAALEKARLLNYRPFVEIAPSREIGEFVSELDAGKDPPGDEGFGQNYRHFRAQYDPAKVIGRPVLVAPKLSGPFTEIEGLTRMCTIISKHRAGESVPTETPVLVGVCLQFNAWQWK